MKTSAVFFPFDSFGSAGTGRGCQLLADAVREMLSDNREERMPARGQVYTPHIQIKELEFATEKQQASWRTRGRSVIRKALSEPGKLVWSSGNHLAVLPLYDELAGASEDTLVIQFDAHLDIFNLTDCEKAPSHGNYLMHVSGSLPRIINVGSRELMLPGDHINKYFEAVLCADQIACQPDDALAQLVKAARKARRIVLDLDCDAFDPTFFPAVLHPAPFGVTPHFLLRVLEAIDPRRIEVVAISEFAPDSDRQDQSLGTLLWLLEWLFLRWYES